MEIKDITYEGGFFRFQLEGNWFTLDVDDEHEAMIELNGGSDKVEGVTDEGYGKYETHTTTYSDISELSILDFEEGFSNYIQNHISEWEREE